MIREILSFARSQRVYLLFLAVLCLIYGLLSLRVDSGVMKASESPRYQAFQTAEKKFQTDINEKGNLEVLFQRKPFLTALFVGYSLLFGGLFLGGCLILGLLALSSTFRAWALRFYPLEDRPWPVAMLLRVVVRFLTVSLTLNLMLSALVWIYPPVNLNLLTLLHTAVMDAGVAVIILGELGFSWKSVKLFGFDLKGRPFWGELGFGLSGYMAVIPLFAAVLMVILALAQQFSFEPEPHPLVDVFLSQESSAQWTVAFSIFLACLWGPFFEEVFFRGLCYPVFKRKMGVLPGALLSAFFFALIHRNEFAFLPIFLLGLGLALLYEKRGNLFAPIILHIFHNSLFIGYFFTAKTLIGQME